MDVSAATRKLGKALALCAAVLATTAFWLIVIFAGLVLTEAIPRCSYQ